MILSFFTLFRSASGQAQPFTLLGDRLGPDQSVGIWGARTTARVSEDGVLQLALDGGLQSAGVYLRLGRSINLAPEHDRLYLSFDIKGAKGGETIRVGFRDRSAAEGTDGYQVEAEQPNGFLVTTSWQRLVMPLLDFPATGENWSLPMPPGSQRPLRRKIDWSIVDMLDFTRWAGPLTVYVKNIVISTNPEAPAARLITPVSVPPRMDLSQSNPLLLTAAFSGPTKWEIGIQQDGATKVFTGLSTRAWAEWDGAADRGEFKTGSCEVRLAYGREPPQVISTNFNLLFPHSPRVQVAQTGYAPEREKTAVVMGRKDRSPFRVIDTRTGKVVLQGISANPVRVELADDWAAMIDFSAVRAPGEYYLEVEDVGRSWRFPIRDGICGELLQQGMKSYYYQRCGTELVSSCAGPYARKACHTNDAWFYEGCTNDVIVRGPHRSSTGGWHDAGDYGKKIVSASDALGYLLLTCEQFPEQARSLHLNVPGDPELPDMLREIKYELDWMLTMQESDGGVQALITSQDFFLNGMPDQDPQPRYLVGVSSCATADFAAVMAEAARVYKPFNRKFSAHCLKAAERSWEFLEKHPDIIPAGGYHDPVGIHGTGTYDDSDDRDERLRAACELFVTTGADAYNRYVREHYTEVQPALFEPPGYLHAQGFGLYSYVLSGKGDASLTDRFRGEILDYARRASRAIEESPYGIAIDLAPNWWNNWTALQSSAALIVADRLAPGEGFSIAALKQLNYVLGCNPLDRCYVTGLGSRPVMDPWQPASFYDGITNPIPGFVLPGANRVAWDLPMQRYQEIHHLPPLKNYVDDHRAASVNEVCLNYNGPFVFITACFAR